MKSKFLEFEADSLKDARKKANAEIPIGFYLVSEEIISDGKRKTVKGFANSEKAAFEKARKEVPPGSEILDETVLVQPSHKTLYVKAFSKTKAITKVKRQVDANHRFVVRLKTSGEKVFLGLFKRPDIYEVKVFQPPVVEVSFKSKTKIRVEISDIKVQSLKKSRSKKSSTASEDAIDRKVEMFQQMGFTVGGVEEAKESVRKAEAARPNEAWFDEAVDKLVSLYLAHGECFSEDDPEVHELRRIGEMLDKRGGIDLMRVAHAEFVDRCDIRGAGRNLEYRWDGIGRWLG